MATEKERIEQLKRMQRRPATPGDLLADLIECNDLSQGKVAARLGVSRITVSRLIQGHRPLSADMAHRLGRFFGNGPELWLNMQKNVDLWDALHMDTAEYAFIEPLDKVALERAA